MLNKEEIQSIENQIKNFFKMAGFEVETEIENRAEDREIVEVNIIDIEDAKMFIGKQGIILADTQLLLRKLIKKEIEKEVYFNLDIDNYKRNKVDNYKSMANSAAEEVLITGQQKVMPPLTSFARRVIHMELAQRDDIETESINMGDERRLVVKPKMI